MNIFAERLLKLINENHTSYSEIALLCKTTRQTVSCYVTGKNVPRLDKLLKLAKHFNVSADYLIGLSNIKSVNSEIKGVCEYTGLTENAIFKIHEMNGKDKALLERVIGVL